VLSGWVGPRFANEGEVGTEPSLSLDIDPAGEPGTRFVERGVVWSYSPMRRRFFGLASMFRGVEVDAVADSASEASDISDAFDGDLDL